MPLRSLLRHFWARLGHLGIVFDAMFWKRLCGQTLGQSFPKPSDHVFPETLWKAFGEHVGEEEEEEEKEGKGEGGGCLFGAS